MLADVIIVVFVAVVAITCAAVAVYLLIQEAIDKRMDSLNRPRRYYKRL